MKVFLVIFSSTPLAPGVFDATAFKVRARSMVAAIAAKKDAIPHPWALATAVPWPDGLANVEDALDGLLATA